MSKILGLTGPTGAGKSTVAATAAEMGFFVVDCDLVARQVTYEKGVLAALADAFGSDIIENGELSRRTLALRAFASPTATQRLNEITLPVIVARIEEMIKGKESVLLDAPTLFESGLNTRCNAVIAVLAAESTRRERITVRDALSSDLADARLSAAKLDEFFISRCDEVIYNDGTLSELKVQAARVLSKYK